MTPEMKKLLEELQKMMTVSYTHLRAHETVLDLVCRLLLEKKKKKRAVAYINKSKTIANNYTRDIAVVRTL